MTCKKIIRAQTIAQMARLPLIYLVDSAGVFLPLQDDVFPDDDDFGRIFRNNAVICAEGIPQIAAIMGNCVAGGGYLPVLCDTLLMTEGSGLYLAGPALVKAAIGQVVDATRNSAARRCTRRSAARSTSARRTTRRASTRLRSLMAQVARAIASRSNRGLDARRAGQASSRQVVRTRLARDPKTSYDVFTDSAGGAVRRPRVIAASSIVGCRHPTSTSTRPTTASRSSAATRRSAAAPCGIVANQKKRDARPPAAPAVQTRRRHLRRLGRQGRAVHHGLQPDAQIPIIFLHDTTGFMVGKDSEQAGIIRAGAKMVNAMSNCVVPEDRRHPRRLLRRGQLRHVRPGLRPVPLLRLAVRQVRRDGRQPGHRRARDDRGSSRERKGEKIDEETRKPILAAVHAGYTEQADIRHGAARGWVDRIIEPHRTREELIAALAMTARAGITRDVQDGCAADVRASSMRASVRTLMAESRTRTRPVNRT